MQSTKMTAASSRLTRWLVAVFTTSTIIFFLQSWSAAYYPRDWRVLTPATFRGGSREQEVNQNGTSDVLLEGHEGGPRIRQATMIYETDRFNEVYERAVDSHVKHGEKWGVPTHILRHDIVDAGFFNKPAFLLGLVIEEMAKPYGQRCNWIVWFDADTIILNPNVPWSLFLPPPDFDDIHVLANQDANGLNAGMMILRVHDWTVEMLAEVVALRHLKQDIHLPFFDQSAVKWTCEQEDYQDHMIYQPHEWWNAFGIQGEPHDSEDWLLHFAGVGTSTTEDKKTVVMGRWIDILENTPDRWMKPLGETKYPHAVEDWWKLIRHAKKTYAEANQTRSKISPTPENLRNATEELQKALRREADNRNGVLTKAITRVEETMEMIRGMNSSVPQQGE